ncbi:circadian locomoter output cycles protein kaput-like isoform X4 [Artemia franciscana]|uniref:circadian locomoter output cycles protein kaput-like isoform X4 n=1 Tax=Artemia franciscana TaxID=6661 RepID=UPI0032DB5047
MDTNKIGMNIPKNLPSSSRIMRNIAEKQRRDKLNGFISELGSIVPFVANAPRKLDKISTLRLAASYLRLNQYVDSSFSTKDFDSNLSTEMLKVEEMLSAMNMIQVVLSSGIGKILHVSENVDNILSYNQVDMLGLSIFSFIHPDDHTAVRQLICPRSFPSDASSFPTCDSVFVGVIRLVQRKLPEKLTLLDALSDIYITKHTPDAKIINSDHRISTITGYFAGEVLGRSALCYISRDDLPLVGVAMKMMLTSPSGEGIIAYRLITCSGSSVYLRSHGTVEFDEATRAVKSFACVNYVINEEEWKKEFEELKEKLKDVCHLGDTQHPGTAPEVSQQMHTANIQTSLSLFENPEISSTEEDAKKKIYGTLYRLSNQSPIVQRVPSPTYQPNLINLPYNPPKTWISISDPDQSQCFNTNDHEVAGKHINENSYGQKFQNLVNDEWTGFGNFHWNNQTMNYTYY